MITVEANPSKGEWITRTQRLGSGGHENKQYEILFTLISHSVILIRARNDSLSSSALVFVTGDMKQSTTLYNKINLVGLGMAVDSLFLPRLQTI